MGDASRLFSFENLKEMQLEGFEILNDHNAGEDIYIQRATLRLKDIVVITTNPNCNQITNRQGVLEILTDTDLK